MRHVFKSAVITFAGIAALLGCQKDPVTSLPELAGGDDAHFQSFAGSLWSEPVTLDAPINLPTSNEQAPAISSDGLSLYFCSNRPPSLGNDLWVARRADEFAPWGAPVNVGTVVNSAAGDCGPSLSEDGLMLFFTSGRPGGAGMNDIYMTTRTDPTDDLSWAPPIRLGSEVNTTMTEFSPFITRWRGETCDGCSAWAELYFERGPGQTITDIFVVRIGKNGQAIQPAHAVEEVNSPDGDGRPTIRFDGREMIFGSNRGGRGGNHDLFVSRRRSPNDAWSVPVVIPEISIAGRHEIHSSLSKDGRTIYFVRGTGTANDIMTATRRASGR
jgi:hypothetical protein